MKKALFATLGILLLLFMGVYAFLYYVPFSEGVRAGELIKISHKGVLIKTWEGQISQGISGAQIFSFSVLDKEEEVIKQLEEYQGEYVKLYYREHFATFPWWGDTPYFIYRVEPDQSPHRRR
ncbi:6-phosphogluconate dehydrogenase [Robiginitalea sp. M366]|uniref:6-phosphogluconate dehydrogenase n=1 Tax=Robiginitalea aestuariiviva TaxID=3036903 RepID=UPI00240DE387|nr:6-phosphogluconate dehydrogenase [Robiginitalea aestuariiviva]MDG1573487.1 6-phosphogluconate dehydrogenase [Robiginitalea aestuariiviva]